MPPNQVAMVRRRSKELGSLDAFRVVFFVFRFATVSRLWNSVGSLVSTRLARFLLVTPRLCAIISADALAPQAMTTSVCIRTPMFLWTTSETVATSDLTSAAVALPFALTMKFACRSDI